jgi:hypothetical protein
LSDESDKVDGISMNVVSNKYTAIYSEHSLGLKWLWVKSIHLKQDKFHETSSKNSIDVSEHQTCIHANAVVFQNSNRKFQVQ